MDEMNVHQFWGISPFIDLLFASAAACPTMPPRHAAQQSSTEDPVCFLQVCPYDCRHTLATVCSHVTGASAAAGGTTHSLRDMRDGQQQMPGEVQPGAAQQQQHQNTQHFLLQQQQKQHQQQQQPCQLHLYIYEAEPEVLARHMLLLAVLFDGRLTVRQRAEMFLELHGNVMLRQTTADYLVETSKWLEEAVAQLSSSASPAAAKPAAHAGQQAIGGGTASNSCPSQKQQVLRVLSAFNLSLLRYQDRDALLETFQRLRKKANFDMSKAWDGRSRKWYGDRYDCRINMVDWDYHMRLSPRGTPFMDPAHGSIVHYHHFRHWRLTGIAHELRDSAYCNTNGSLLSTAYGRSKEYKDRQLRDVGRSVSAFGYWGDILNSPYHAFGTVADDPGLFKVANKQFTYTAVDVAEHNLLGIINKLRAGCSDAQQAAVAYSSPSSSACSIKEESHRAHAARGPTSMHNLTAGTATDQPAAAEAAGQTAQEQQQGEQGAEADDECQQQPALQDAVQQVQRLQLATGNKQVNTDVMQGGQSDQQQQQQQQQNDELVRLAALEAAINAVSIERFVASTTIYLLSGDIKRSLSSKPKYAGMFTAATVGHRHVHFLGPEYGLACLLKQPAAVVFVESGQNMVQLNAEQVDAFEQRVVELAAGGGFVRHPRVGSKQAADMQGQQQQQQREAGGAAHQCGGTGWQLPPGHFALAVVGRCQVD